MAFAGEALSNRTDSLSRFELDTHGRRRETESGRQAITDGAAKILELRALEDHGGINVDDAITSIGRELLSVEQKLNGIGAMPFGRRVGEMHANIAESECAEDSIGDGVAEDIGIGVAGETEFAGDRYAAENERASGFNAVGIPALADTEGGIHS